MPPRLVLAFAAVLVALILPAAASAADYCVPTTAACPGGIGTAQATFQAALTQASVAADADKIYLASGTFTAPSTGGFSYNLPAGPDASPAPSEARKQFAYRSSGSASSDRIEAARWATEAYLAEQHEG